MFETIRNFFFAPRSVAAIAASFSKTIAELDGVADAHVKHVADLAEENLRMQEEMSASRNEISKARGFAANLRRLVGPASDAVQAS